MTKVPRNRIFSTLFMEQRYTSLRGFEKNFIRLFPPLFHKLVFHQQSRMYAENTSNVEASTREKYLNVPIRCLDRFASKKR